VKSVLGLSDLVVPGEDSRNKQLREIEILMHSAPIQVRVAGGGERAVGEGKTPTFAKPRRMGHPTNFNT